MPFDGPIKITGSGPRNATVELLASDGTLLGVTKASPLGDFSLELMLEPGEHSLHAKCTRPTGGVVESPTIEVEIAAAADDDVEVRPLSGQFDREELLRARAEERYCELVEAAANGEQFDTDYAELVLLATNHSVADFLRDWDSLMEGHEDFIEVFHRRSALQEQFMCNGD